MEQEQEQEARRRLRLKCRYEGDIRNVILTADTNFLQLKRRLSNDYGFEVALKYEDRDGDLITLASQNDFDDLFFGDSDTVNVIVTEATMLPSVQRRGAGTPKLGIVASSGGGIFSASSLSSSRDQWSHRAPMMQSQSAFRNAAGNRFPNIFEQQNDLAEKHNIRWKKGEMLGQGAFGVVYLGLNIDSGELMAVKQMALDEVSTKELGSLENELNLLRNLRHPNIVRYIGTEINPLSLSIFLEYVPGGSLKALVDKFGQLEEPVVRSYTRQLLLGLEYLHRNGIAHRDIKGANCLVGNDGVIKLADFGNSKQWRSNTANTNTTSQPSGDIKGTPSWMAPEVIKEQGGKIAWKKADVWSLACTVLEMTTGKAPWSQFSNSVTILYHIACQDTLPEYPMPASVELVTFLNICLQRDPVCRPDITSLLLHPFVASIGSNSWGLSSVRPSTVSTTLGQEWGEHHRQDNGWRGDVGRSMAMSNLHISTSQSTHGVRANDQALPTECVDPNPESSPRMLTFRGNNPFNQISQNPDLCVDGMAESSSVSSLGVEMAIPRSRQDNRSGSKSSSSKNLIPELYLPGMIRDGSANVSQGQFDQVDLYPDTSFGHISSRQSSSRHLLPTPLELGTNTYSEYPITMDSDKMRRSPRFALHTENSGESIGLENHSSSGQVLMPPIVSSPLPLPGVLGRNHLAGGSVKSDSRRQSRSGQQKDKGTRGNSKASRANSKKVVSAASGATFSDISDGESSLSCRESRNSRRNLGGKSGKSTPVSTNSSVMVSSNASISSLSGLNSGLGLGDGLPLSYIDKKRSGLGLDDANCANSRGSQGEGGGMGIQLRSVNVGSSSALMTASKSSLLIAHDDDDDCESIVSTSALPSRGRVESLDLDNDQQSLESSHHLQPLYYASDDSLGIEAPDEYQNLDQLNVNEGIEEEIDDSSMMADDDDDDGSSIASCEELHAEPGGGDDVGLVALTMQKVNMNSPIYPMDEDVGNIGLSYRKNSTPIKVSLAEVRTGPNSWSNSKKKHQPHQQQQYDDTLQAPIGERRRQPLSPPIDEELESVQLQSGISNQLNSNVQRLSPNGNNLLQNGAVGGSPKQKFIMGMKGEVRSSTNSLRGGPRSTSLILEKDILLGEEAMDGLRIAGSSLSQKSSVSTAPATAVSRGLTPKEIERGEKVASRGFRDTDDKDKRDELQSAASIAASLAAEVLDSGWLRRCTPITLEEHTSAVTRLRAPACHSSGSNLLISASTDGTVRIWSPATSETESRAVLDANSFVLASSGKGDKDPSFNDQKVERRISLGAAGEKEPAAMGGKGVKIWNVWAEDSCDTIWAACSDGALRVWSGGEGKPVRFLRGHEDSVSVMEGMGNAGGSLQTQSCLVATGSNDKTVRIWDARCKRAQVFLFKGHADGVLALRWGEGGRTVLSAGKDKMIKVWDTRAGRLRVTLEKHFGAVTALRSIPDQANISAIGNNGNSGNAAFVSGARDSHINLWTLNGACVGTQAAHRGTVSFLSDINFNLLHKSSLQGSPIVVSLGADNIMKVWDLKKFRPISEVTVGASNSVATKAVWVGQSIVTASTSGLVRLWDYQVPQQQVGGVVAAGASPTAIINEGPHPPAGAGVASSDPGLGGAGFDWQGYDLASHTQSCTDLISTQNFVASSSKSGQVMVWSK